MPGDPVRLLAIYLPQFHPIPENDRWWGKGFTEWINVTKARPLFPGHYQPHLPADLGFCDLRLPETRQAQADLARAHGIHGFCYYHYWFNGQRLLERPFDEVLESGQPDFPFCLCWANEHWTKTWDGDEKSIVMPQKYTLEDDREHIRWLLGAFKDPRYIRVNGKPLFLVYRIQEFPTPRDTAALWREEARKAGVSDLYLVKVECYDDPRKDPAEYGFDAAMEFQPDGYALYFGAPALRRGRAWDWLRKLGLSDPVYATNYVYTYEDLMRRMLARPRPAYKRFPCVTPCWDNTPRHKQDAFIFMDSTPALYQQWLSAAIDRARTAPPGEEIVFINAWNEWAEGNHLEPDLRFGRGHLEATRQALEEAVRANSPARSPCAGRGGRMSQPRVSIITPVYNGKKYLGEAAQCVFGQTFKDWEWLLIDDGSTDGSDREAQRIAAGRPEKVRYLEHPGHANHGQFGSRVHAAKHVRADVVAFLDQDDVWDHDYLEQHWRLWETVRDRQPVLSHGPGRYWYPDEPMKDYVQPMPPGTPRVFNPGELLDTYFSTFYADTPCPCCTLIRRDVLPLVEHLAPLAQGSACEDQYLWWYVAARWPVATHPNAWVRYRQHGAMSMVQFTRTPDAFRRQELTFLRTVHDDLKAVDPEHPLLASGRLADKIAGLAAAVPAPEEAGGEAPRRTALGAARSLLKGLLSMNILKDLSSRLASRKVRHRMANGVEPLSDNWGIERGEPLCRRYLLQYLMEHTADVRGRCLEFQDNHYTGFLGGDAVTKFDILNLEPEPKATLVADLTKPNDIPSDTFDCIICTHVLHVIPELDRFLGELHRILAPGGVLLMAVPHVSMAGPEWHELWRFTDEGLHYLLGKAFGKNNVSVRAYGNSLTAAGSLRGLVVHEFTDEEMNHHDPRFAVEIRARAVKQA